MKRMEGGDVVGRSTEIGTGEADQAGGQSVFRGGHNVLGESEAVEGEEGEVEVGEISGSLTEMEAMSVSLRGRHGRKARRGSRN